ncbi:MAG: HAD-IA family hydrolase [Psychroserpens sp.]|uniref:HAD-IA family hydrolase n=1 Tax=Psychroserpens sp. TaxID=2020870 RepID=UPI003C9ABDF8
MTPKVLFIGSIGVVAETSEIQRQAYNQALKESHVDWVWTPEIYRKLLQRSGGQDRINMLAVATGKDFSKSEIEKIHARKTELACATIVKERIAPRPGLVNLIAEAKVSGAKVAWVTTTGHKNTNAILEASAGKLKKSDFDHIFHRDEAPKGKPSPDIYNAALKHFGVKAHECIAIEDSLNSLLASRTANIFTVVTLGAYHDENLDNIADLTLASLEGASWNDLSKRLQSKTA